MRKSLPKLNKHIAFLILLCCGLLSGLFTTANAQGSIDCRFATNPDVCSNDQFCVNIQIKGSDGADYIGISSIRMGYNHEALEFLGSSNGGIINGSYTELNFGANDGSDPNNPLPSDCTTAGGGIGASPYSAHGYDGLFPGDLLLTLVLQSPSIDLPTGPLVFACPNIADQWTDVSEVCFEILDPNADPDLHFLGQENGDPNDQESGTNFNSSYNDPTNKYFNGSFESYNQPYSVLCGLVDDLEGCTDESACNYNPAATINVGCDYGVVGCADPCNVVLGCTDPTASNYDPEATCENGTCIISDPGCTDPAACNYDPNAVIDVGNCSYPVAGCECGDLVGCTNPMASNYNASATCDDGSCNFVGSNDGFVNCRFVADEDACSTSDEYCVSVQIQGANGADLIGISSIRMSYDHEVLNFSGSATNGSTVGSYTSINFDGDQATLHPDCSAGLGITPYSEHGFDGLFPGDILMTMVLLNPTIGGVSFACPSTAGIWTDVADICFEVLDPAGDPNLQFVGVENGDPSGDESGTNFSSDDNDPDNKYMNGSLDGLNDSYNDICGGISGINGCTDPAACNYDPDATDDDGLCDYGLVACTDPCTAVLGCTDPAADNYDANATCDFGNCTYGGVNPSVNAQFVGNEAACDDGEYCVSVQLQGENGADLLGVSSIRMSYDSDVLLFEGSSTNGMTTGSYTSINFDNDQTTLHPDCVAGLGITPYSEQGFDGLFPGDILATVVLLNPSVGGITFACPGIEGAWVDVAEICFAVIDASGNPNLQFVGVENGDPSGDESGTNFGSDTNNPDDKYYNGSFGSLTTPFNVLCDEDTVFLGCTDEDACNYNPQADTDNGSCEYPIQGCDCGDVTGCTDSEAFNYNPLATCDDDSCDLPTVSGCTDLTACNYDSEANVNDGSCTYPISGCACFDVVGCTDSEAINYNALATCDNGSCEFIEIPGCTDPAACNYEPTATVSVGTCEYPESGCACGDVTGCMDPAATNYSPLATCDPLSTCIYNEGVGSIDAVTFDDMNNNGILDVGESGLSGIVVYLYDEDGNFLESATSGSNGEFSFPNLAIGNYSVFVPVSPSGYTSTTSSFVSVVVVNGESSSTSNFGYFQNQVSVSGCTDPSACNYDSSATADDGSCLFPQSGCACGDVSGCTDITASNYNASATCDDGSCQYTIVFGCINPSSCNYNPNANTDDGSCFFPQSGCACDDLIGCTDASASNYNASATCDDGSCQYTTGTGVFADYTWLNGLVNQSGCTNEVITVYESGGYNFVYVQTDDGNALYFESGELYCTDAPNFSCVSAYGLSTIVDSWSCLGGSGNTPEFFNDYSWLTSLVNPAECADGESVTVYQQGIYNFVYVNGALYFQDGTFYCQDSPNYSCVQQYGLTSMVNSWNCGDIIVTGPEQVFQTYSWLSSIVNPGDCSNETVTVYTTGNYEFIYVNGTLYFEDGTFYCQDSPSVNYYCVNAYGLTNISTSWSCGDGEGSLIYPIFNTYSWLSGVVDPINCVGETVSVYSLDGYEFIHVTGTDGMGSLYFEDGTFYCADSPGYSCLDLYLLTSAPIDTWSCPQDKGEVLCTEFFTPIDICHSMDNYRIEDVVQTEEGGSINIYSNTCFRYQPMPGASKYQDLFVMVCNDAGNCTQLEYNIMIGDCNVPGTEEDEQEDTADLARIDENTNELDFRVYPNPSNGRVFISIQQAIEMDQTIRVFDITGSPVAQIEIPGNSTDSSVELDLTDVPSGFYLVELQTAYHKAVQRLVIE